MDENTGNNKVLGLPSIKYVKICYVLVLVSAGLGLLISILAGIGLGTPAGTPLVNLVGLAGWIMALVGWLAFQKDFTVIELSHLRFISILFIALFLVGIVIGSLIGVNGLIWMALSLILSVIQLGLLFLGFRAWDAREEITQDSLKAEFEIVKTRLQNRSDV
jgi:hypothetical protein